MSIKPKDASRLVEAKGFVQEFKNRLPLKVDANKLGLRSKLPFKAISLRDLLLYRITELGEASCSLYEDNMMASAFTLTRGALETSAMLHWLYKKMVETVTSKKVGAELDELLMKALLGRKDRPGYQPINVQTYVDHLGKKFKGASIKDSYSALSEYAHPNWFGVMSLYGKFDKQARCLNLGWPEAGVRVGEGLPLLCVALGVFKYYYEQTSHILPNFIETCDHNVT